MWWSEAILGGDFPVEVWCRFIKLMGVDHLSQTEPIVSNKFSLPQEVIMTSINHKPNVFLSLIGRITKEFVYAPGIVMQVATVILMASGATMTRTMKEEAIKSCNEEWCKTDVNRKVIIDEFRHAVMHYEHQPTFIKFSSLETELGKGRDEKEAL